jgi:flagellar hook-associated protein 1 FlgK
MKLADQIGATVRHGEDGSVDVVVGGMTLVAGSTSSEFTLVGAMSPSGIAADRPRLVTASGGFTVVPGGTAAGKLNAMNAIIPDNIAALDAIANDLATRLNAAHQSGYDLAGVAGGPLLGSTTTPLTAASIKVMITDPALVAASSVGPGVASLDNGNADKIAQLRTDPAGTDATYRRMIVELGVQSAVSKRNLDIQSVITTQVDAARESVAGVNLDEEMANMLSFQHAYAAAGRMVTAIDETLDVLINRTGLVGR